MYGGDGSGEIFSGEGCSLMSTILPLSEHNLDYFLEAYAVERQPRSLRVPYDRWGNEITIPAPLREDVQRAVLEFDFKRFFDCDGIEVGFLGNSAYSKRAHVIDPRNLELESEKIADGLCVYNYGTTYVYSTRRDSNLGLERLAYAVRQFHRSKDGKCEVEHLDVGLSIIRLDR